MKEDKTLTAFVSFLIFLVIILIVVIVMFGLSRNSSVKSIETASSSAPLLDAPNLNIASPEPSPSLTPISKIFPLGKSFALSIKDSKGNEVGKVDYFIKQYEFTNQVVVNSVYEALLKKNKELLVLHVELTNNTNYTFKVAAGDQVRLTKGDEGKLIAPDISKDPVEVRPKSTAETKIGFIVEKDGKSLIIHLGEPGGDTQSIPIPRDESL